MPPSDRKIVAFGLGLLACGAGLLLATGAILGHAAAPDAQPAPPADRCAAPAWVGTLPVSTGTADRLARWAMLCADVEHGRINRATYAVGWRELMAPPVATETAPRPVVWAARVIDFSSEWSRPEWSAQEVLGSPDVVGTVSDPKAWTSLHADSPSEHITVELAAPVRASAVDVYETVGPGVVAVELLDASGKPIATAREAAPGSTPAARRFSFDCTETPVARIKVVVDSSATGGWTELDAIGVVPCGD